MVPCVQFSGIAPPFFDGVRDSRYGFIAHVRVALYSSPGTPSLPVDFLFARFRSPRPISATSYSRLSHGSLSGSCMIFVGSDFGRISRMSSSMCISSPSHSCSGMYSFRRQSVWLLAETCRCPFSPSSHCCCHPSEFIPISFLWLCSWLLNAPGVFDDIPR